MVGLSAEANAAANGIVGALAGGLVGVMSGLSVKKGVILNLAGKSAEEKRQSGRQGVRSDQ